MTDTVILDEPAPRAPERGLLAPDEPGPVELYNQAGAAPVVVLCDHAAPFIPRALGSLGLSESELARHIAWDIGAAEVTRGLARMLDARAVLSRFSRLIVDPNRDPADPTLIPEISDGVIVPANRALSEVAVEARIATFHRPYHDAVARTLDALLERETPPVVISVHSFTPVMKGRERPWQVGILWNDDPRLPEPLMARLRAQGLTVGDNQPYSGRDGHGYSLHRHADARGLANVLIELRQDLVDTRHGAAEWAERLNRTLRAVLEDPGLYKIQDRP